MAHNDAIAAAISQVMCIASLTMQAVDLQKKNYEESEEFLENSGMSNNPSTFDGSC